MKEVKTRLTANVYFLLILAVLNIGELIFTFSRQKADFLEQGYAADTVNAIMIALVILVIIYSALEVFIALKFLKAINGGPLGKAPVVLSALLFIFEAVNLIYMVVSANAEYTWIRGYFSIALMFTYGEFLHFRNKIGTKAE